MDVTTPSVDAIAWCEFEIEDRGGSQTMDLQIAANVHDSDDKGINKLPCLILV